MRLTGTRLKSPDGRLWLVGVQTGKGPGDMALVLMHRADRRRAEQVSVWKSQAEVDGWELSETHEPEQKNARRVRGRI